MNNRSIKNCQVMGRKNIRRITFAKRSICKEIYIFHQIKYAPVDITMPIYRIPVNTATCHKRFYD